MKITGIGIDLEFEGEIGSWGVTDDGCGVECEVSRGDDPNSPWFKVTLTLSEAIRLGDQAIQEIADEVEAARREAGGNAKT